MQAAAEWLKTKKTSKASMLKNNIFTCIKNRMVCQHTLCNQKGFFYLIFCNEGRIDRFKIMGQEHMLCGQSK